MHISDDSDFTNIYLGDIIVMKKLIIVLVCLCIVPALADAGFRPKTYICYRASGPIVIDGRLDEGSWLRAPETDLFVDIEGDRQPLPWFGTRVKLVWDDEYLYCGAMLEDTNIWGSMTGRDVLVCRDDNDFEVFIDIDDDGRWYYEFEMNALNTIYDLVRANKYARLEIEWDFEGIKTAVHFDGTLNNREDIDRAWYCEIAFPMKALAEYAGTMPVPPHDGDVWRIDFPRVQYYFDDTSKNMQKVPGTRAQNWVWSPPLVINNHWIEALGYMRFSTVAVGVQVDSEDALEFDRPFLTVDPGTRKKVKPGAMTLIPGGEFTLGPDPLDPETSPAHTVKVESFYMDTYEVTIAEYAAFLNDVKNDDYYCQHMAHYDCGIVKNADGSYNVSPGRGEYPIVYVDMKDAEAYAAWAGKRLPTEAEWEYACRFNDGRTQPWGSEELSPERCNFNYLYGGTLPVGSLPKGVSGKGLHDMAGNVWEMCAGEFKRYPGGKSVYDFTPTSVYRGGSWATPPKVVHASVRELRSQRTPFVGFRCARSGK